MFVTQLTPVRSKGRRLTATRSQPSSRWRRPSIPIRRMKSIVDPIDGFHPRWETNELFDACIKAIEAKQPSYTIPYEDVVIFINSIKMALKRLDLKVDTCSCLSALAEKL